MKKTAFCLTGLLLLLGLTYLPGCVHEERAAPEALVKKDLLADIIALEKYLQDSLLPVAQKAGSSSLLQQRFIKTRILYKRIEWLAEYFMPSTTRFVNGPPLPEVEFEENKMKDPEGLQVLEGLLFPEIASENKQEIIRQIKLLEANCIRYKDYFNVIDPGATQVFDAAKLQVFRIITLGISGFDVPLAQTSMPEAAESLLPVYKALRYFKAAPGLDSVFHPSIAYLQQHTDFISFDRMEFITAYANPLSRYITRLQEELNIPLIKDTRLLNPSAPTLFDTAVFNVNAYTTDSSYYINEAKTALGRRLFYNTLLSGNNSRSCASCHQPDKAFTDGLVKAVSLDGKGMIRRNTPTLLNAALQPAQFYDLRATLLENQARDVISNKDEMHGSMEDAARELWKDETYRALFTSTFADASQGIKPIHIQHALASYIRSLSKLNSRFDRYMQGDQKAMNNEEKAGFNLFMGKAKCGTCHFMPLFSGVVPPAFLKIETEVIGVPDDSRKKLDPDQGRYEFGQMEPFRNAFKTTTVRNSTLTAPYMHNGVYNTLEEVIDFYDQGGGNGLGFTVSNQTLATDKLNLAPAEKKALIAFIQTLNDK